MSRHSIALFICCLLSGCSVSFPQIQALANLTWSEGNETSEMGSALWVGSFGQYGTTLSPYQVDEAITVFANEDGDAVVFDGWIVTAIRGFGLRAPLDISGREGLRKIRSGGEVSELECSPWRAINGSEGYVEWEQPCSVGAGYLYINPQGNIEKISVNLGDDRGVLVLQARYLVAF